MNESGEFKGNVSARLLEVERRLERIENNHLPHIQSSIENLGKEVGKRVDRMTWIFVVAASGLIGNLILAVLKG